MLDLIVNRVGGPQKIFELKKKVCEKVLVVFKRQYIFRVMVAINRLTLLLLPALL